MKRVLPLVVLCFAACGGSGGSAAPTPAPTPVPGPTNLTGRSIETDAIVGTSVVSGSEVTLTAGAFFTLQTSLSLHANGVAYMRPIDGDMSAAAVGPFVFWVGNRSVGWPASTTTLTYATEASLSGDAAAVAAIDAVVARFNSFGLANVNGQRVTFARAASASGSSCSMRVDPNDVDIVANARAGWTRYLLNGNVITSCTIIFRSIADARSVIASHEMVHGLGLGHTLASVSGVTLMDAGTINDGHFASLARVVATNIALSFRRRPGTLLTGSTEDERSASALGGGVREIGIP